VSGDERRLPSDSERDRDRALLAALAAHEPVGERYARSGRTPTAAARPPAMKPVDAGSSGDDDTPVLALEPRPRRSVWWRLGQIAALLLVVVLAYGAFNLWHVWSTGRSDQARPVDAIVVMGAAQYDGRPSPQLAARLDQVVELWPTGIAPLVVVTGGGLPGDRFTEAEASAAYLEQRGVPATAIVTENEGTNTFESLEGAAELVGDRVETVLIVTDPYHSLRSRLTAQEVGFTAYVAPTDTSVVTGAAEFRRNLGEAAGVALGRIIGFERLSGLTD
jgi:uncharacterized SAM-binding protein YcdF (DUF218 family)